MVEKSWIELARLQDFRERVAGIGGLRGHEIVDVRPVLRPDVAEEMRRQRPVGRDRVAIFLAQLHADVGVQREIQRPHLLPEPVHLFRELIGRHVVFAAPHRAGVGEAQLLCADIRQLGKPRVVALHRRSDRVPPVPDFEETLRIPGRGHDFGDLLDVQALLRLGAGGAPLPFAVIGAELGGKLRQLFGRLRISRRRQLECELEERELAPEFRRYFHTVEPRRLLRVSRDGVGVGLRCPRAHRFAVFGDVGLGNPARL